MYKRLALQPQKCLHTLRLQPRFSIQPFTSRKVKCHSLKEREVTHEAAQSNITKSLKDAVILSSFVFLTESEWNSALAAQEALQYNPAAGEDFIKNVTGAGYLILVIFFGYRVLTRRARKAREERIAGPKDSSVPTTPPQPETSKPVTSFDALIGAVQAGVIAYGLFLFSTQVQGIIESQDLPNGYTARNISITVRTILVGLFYLITFIFGANSIGLLGLTVQILIDPDSVKDDGPSRDQEMPKGPQLPRIRVTLNPDEVKRAFDSAEKIGRTSAFSQDTNKDASSK